MCSLKVSPHWAVPCLPHGADCVWGDITADQGLQGWHSLTPAATPVPRKAWWDRGRRAKSSSVASLGVLGLIETDFDPITQYDLLQTDISPGSQLFFSVQL